MNCTRSLFCAAITLLMYLASSPPASASAMVPCGGEPFAFKDADLNVVILPYFQAGASTHELNEVGLQLALLVKLETLYRAMAYERWGIILLAGVKEECKPPQRIASDLLKTEIAPGKQLVMVWGKIYQQDNDIYVQTFARSYRNSMPDAPPDGANFGLQIGDRNFSGRMAVEEYAFPPERVPVSMIEEIGANFKKAVFLYSAPTLSSPKRPIPIEDFLKCYRCPDALAFSVLGRTGDWVEVRTNKNEHGYLAAHLDGPSLSQEMPEVSFLQGLMGFVLYHDQLPPDERRGSSERLQVARQALLDYAERDVTVQEPETKAGALQLVGAIDFSLRKGDASNQFDSAYRLVPYSSDARNLAAMLRVYSAYNSSNSKLRPTEMADDFLAAAALDPQNLFALSNLQSFYELLGEPASQSKVDPSFSIGPEELQAQIAKVRAIREKLAKTGSPSQ